MFCDPQADTASVVTQPESVPNPGPILGSSSTSGTDQPPSSSTAQDKGKGKLEDLDQAENLQLALSSQDPSKVDRSQ